ncbi:MAG TPA: DinB family protein [Actinomycetota bacterium]|nr:DinB family protein [Actinomycetota bacterium]
MNAYLAGQLATLEEWHDHAIDLVAELDEDPLNWRPAIPDANTIASLIRHSIGSMVMWFARALDEPYERDRDAEFAARDTAPQLVAALEASRDRVRAQFERLDSVDPATERVVRRFGAPADETFTAGWCVAHAVRHVGEHWGQIQLTRDLSAGR